MVPRDFFDYAVALLGILVPIGYSLHVGRVSRIANLEKRVDLHSKILAVLTNDPTIG